MNPITPTEAAFKRNIPDFVIKAFNDVITEKFCEGVATCSQEEIIARILEYSNATLKQVFDGGWLNIETVYRKSGWKVEYDKPGYNENYPATFTFSSR